MTIAWNDLDPRDVEWVLTPADLDRFLADLRRIKDDWNGWHLTLDLETTGLREHAPDARVVMIAFTVAHALRPKDTRNVVIGLSHPDGPFHARWRPITREIATAIRDSQLPLIGQNLRFDLRWLYTHSGGIDLTPQLAHDTGLTSHLLDENQRASLKSRAMATFGVPRWDDFDFGKAEIAQRAELRQLAKGKPDKVTVDEWAMLRQRSRRLLGERADFFDFGLYNVRDTYWTWALCATHLAQLGVTSELDPDEDRDEIRLGRFYLRCGVEMVRSITRMEQRGWHMDREWTAQRLVECDTAGRTAFAELIAMSEIPLPEDPADISFESSAGYFKAWTADMLRQGQLRVIASTPGGQPSWTKNVLNRLAREGSRAARTMLEHRHVTRQASYLRSWLETVSASGKVHATYSYYHVVTGRTSCSDPNMQQVTKQLRPAFTASPGHLLIEADLSQIEMRTAAHISQCKPMIEAFRRGDDLHRLMAAFITGKPPEEITPEERQHAKALNFGLLFLMGPAGLRNYAEDTYGVHMTVEEAEEGYAAYFRLWDGLAGWHQQVPQEAMLRGCVVSPLGRIRRFPGMNTMNDYEWSGVARQAVNSPVQSFASDLLQMGVTKIGRELPDAHVLGMVHDSVIIETPEELAHDLAPEIVRCLTHLEPELLALGVRLSVPLAADVTVGFRWGERPS